MEESEASLEQLLINIKSTKEDMFSSFKAFYNLPVRKDEYNIYVSAILNRAIALTKGYLTLARENNYFAAVPLIRLQVDNSLRLYASLLVTDFHKFFLDYLDGKAFKQIKDRSGNKMHDAYLVNKLEQKFSGLLKLYSDTSGYIHMSAIHSKMITQPVPGKERVLGTRIGSFDFFSIKTKIIFCENMHVANQILLLLLRDITNHYPQESIN